MDRERGWAVLAFTDQGTGGNLRDPPLLHGNTTLQ